MATVEIDTRGWIIAEILGIHLELRFLSRRASLAAENFPAFVVPDIQPPLHWLDHAPGAVPVRHARRLTGDLIPSGEVTFGQAGQRDVDGQKGAVLEFKVHACAKVDVGTRKFGSSAFRKVWGGDTQQKIQIVLLPKEKEDGTVTFEVRADIVSATATPQRQA